MSPEHFFEERKEQKSGGEVSPPEYQTQRFLETINQDILSGIVGELLGKSSIEPNSDDRVNATVSFDEARKASGWHDAGSVTINAAKFDFNSDYKKDYRRILSTYIHEYVHACAIGSGSSADTGFKYTDEDGTVKHIPLNEGFTELIADYVYEEYLRRSGDLARLGHTSHKRTVRGYLEERRDAMELVHKISQDAGIPEDIVFGAYMRAYFTQDTQSFEDSF